MPPGPEACHRRIRRPLRGTPSLVNVPTEEDPIMTTPQEFDPVQDPDVPATGPEAPEPPTDPVSEPDVEGNPANPGEAPPTH
jgi:hypothetical protein